jgi:hypothetical protein
MPIKPENLPAIVTFFNSAAWKDLLQQVENAKPSPPMIQADALHATSRFRQREGFEMCLAAMMKEAGIIAVALDSNGKPSESNPETEAMEELRREGSFIDTTED